MKKELSYFKIEDCYGGNQNWFTDWMMKMGGCAAVTACDLCIYMNKLNKNINLYPYDINLLSKSDYINFSKIMKPYLKPRTSGINTLKLYIDGFEKYMEDNKEDKLKLTPFSGENSLQDAIKVIKKQIEMEIPIPYLLLKHKNKSLKNLVWHWFLIVGYEEIDDKFYVKIATYGEYNWIDFKELYNTEHDEKGGMIIIENKVNNLASNI